MYQLSSGTKSSSSAGSSSPVIVSEIPAFHTTSGNDILKVHSALALADIPGPVLRLIPCIMVGRASILRTWRLLLPS
jgi:hypothetical protein